MTPVNIKVCKSIMAKKKWSVTYCLLCSVHNRADCDNLKAIREKEDTEFEQTVRRFDERGQDADLLLQEKED